MTRFLILSTAALLLSGSLGNADNQLIPNDNDHMQALNTVIERSAGGSSYSAGVVTSTTELRIYAATAVSPISRGFLLHSNENDSKRVENQYVR